jgi:hypothetical protein
VMLSTAATLSPTRRRRMARLRRRLTSFVPPWRRLRRVLSSPLLFAELRALSAEDGGEVEVALVVVLRSSVVSSRVSQMAPPVRVDPDSFSAFFSSELSWRSSFAPSPQCPILVRCGRCWPSCASSLPMFPSLRSRLLVDAAKGLRLRLHSLVRTSRCSRVTLAWVHRPPRSSLLEASGDRVRVRCQWRL